MTSLQPSLASSSPQPRDKPGGSSWPIVAALLVGGLAYLTSALRLGYLSDDYFSVFGGALTPVLPLAEALRMGGFGGLSVVRLLSQPVNGYLPWLLGAPMVHLLQIGLHLLVGWALYVLLRKLRWAQAPAAWAAAFFLCAPWVSQAAVWWTANPSVISTLLVFLGAIVYVGWRDTGSRKPWRLGACLVLLFISLLFYELWLAGFLLFWAIEFQLQRARGESHERSPARDAMAALKVVWPVLVPFLAWTLLARLTYHAEARQSGLTLHRLPRVLLSVNLRAVQWITLTPWRTAPWAALRELAFNPLGMALALLASVAVVAAIIHGRRANRGQDQAPTREPSLTGTLVLALGLFEGARLVFVIQGAVATLTRHNYGAAAGAAVALAGMQACALRGLAPSGRAIVNVAAGCIVIICALASLGIEVGYRDTALAEQVAYETLAPVSASLPGGTTIVVAGRPDDASGELTFFSEYSGVWLEERLRRVNPGVFCYVVPAIDATDPSITITVRDHTGWKLPDSPVSNHLTLPPDVASQPLSGDQMRLRFSPNMVKLFEWSNGRLVQRPRQVRGGLGGNST